LFDPSGAPFVDYYLGDYVALPPEHSSHFSERLSLMPPCYIVNDLANMMGDILYITKNNRALASSLQSDIGE
jgi:predicted O-linked N-acetylglucosamine transferase (SPINDLY family)